jgi:translocation and assembly module TamB
MRALRYFAYIVALLAFLAGGAWYWALHTSPGARWVMQQVAQATGLRVAAVDGDIAGGLHLRESRFATNTVDVSIASLVVSVDFDFLPLSVEVTSARAEAVSIVIADGGGEDAPTTDVAEVLQGLVLPFPLRVSELRVAEFGISVAGVEEQADSLALVASWHEKLVVERLWIETELLRAELRGALDLGDDNAFTLDLDTHLPPELTRLDESLQVAVRSTGTPTGIDYRATVGTIATVEGSVRWEQELEALAAIVLDQLDLDLFVDKWPAGFPVAGRIEASLDDERLAVSDALLTIAGTEVRLLVDGAFDRETDQVSGNLRWENLRWPVPQEETRIYSETADVRLNGTLDNWYVDGSIALRTEELPQGRFVITAAGDRDGIRGRVLDSDILGGHVAGDVTYSWTGTKPWSANLMLRDVRLDAFLSDREAVVTGRVEAAGTVRPLEFQAALRDVTGQIRGLEILANGAIEYGPEGFIAKDVHLVHATSTVKLDGALMQPNGLAIDADVTDVGAYTQAASGSVMLTGRVSLADGAGMAQAKVESPSLVVRGRELAGLQVQLEASDEGQSVDLRGTHLDTRFTVRVEGLFDNWRDPLGSRFDGAIAGFEIDLEDEHAMRLKADAPLRFSSREASLEDFCVADQTGARLCAEAAWHRDGEYSIELQLAAMPIAISEHLADTGLVFDQVIDGSFSWHHDDAGTGGSGNLRLSAGSVSPADEPESAVATGEGKLDFDIRNGQLLSGDLELPLPSRGHVNGSFAVLDVTAGGESGITGNLDVDIFNIRVLSRLSPYLDSASGALRANVEVTGTVAEPVARGKLVIEEGRFVYLPIGLDIEDVNLTGSMDSDMRFDLSGTFRSGDGYAELSSRADYSDANEPGIDFRLRGNNLTLIDVPDVLIRIDPDIDVALSRKSLAINGELNVSHARIRPTNLATGRVSESEDIVIVAGELPDPPEDKPAEDGLDYRGELRVSLGDDVVVDLDVARATVTGSTIFDWQGGPIPIASGRYLVGGNIAAFGQVLEIEEGIVHFPKVPADQPLIRIVAEREIFGNTSVKRAGVLIDGPVRRPTVEAYTLPLTTEERALTLLVTGSDFDYEQGVGAVDFGTYIAPRLFVSYGVGVFERENIISARFDIARGWGIKASSGSKESGIDLNYRFEN